IEPSRIQRLPTPGSLNRIDTEQDCSIYHLGVSGLPFPGTRCRALLLHPRVIARLRAAVPRLVEPCDDWALIEAILQDPVLDRESQVAEILSAVPEWDGVIDPGGDVVFPHFKIPEGSPEVESDCYFVVVVDCRSSDSFK